jgi:hypothetical protein
VLVQLNVGLVDTPVAPFDGDGFDGAPGALPPPPIVTVKGLPQGETTDVWLAHLACTFTENVPEESHIFDTADESGCHPEFVPSPHS